MKSIQIFLYNFYKGYKMVILLEDSDNIQYSCNNCDYNTLCKKDFVKHLNTKKHEIKTNGYIKVTDYDSENDLLKEYICECGKGYKYRQGLYRHKLKCNIKINENKEDLKDVVLKVMNENNKIKNTLLKENDKLRQQIREQNNEIKKQNEQIIQLIQKIGNNCD